MFCVNCGTANEDGVKFCVNCGKPMEDTSGAAPAQKPVKEKKPLNTKALIIGVAASVVLFAALVIGGILINNAASTIDLNQYITVSAYGFDGYGNISYEIDWKAIAEKYGKKVTFTSKAKKELGVLLNLADPVDELKGSVSVKFEKRDHLTNGDMVEYDFEVDEKAKEYVNFRAKHKPAKYMVSGLEKVENFDPFESLVLSFTGNSGEGYCGVDYNNSGSFVSNYYYDFSVDSTYGLSNGDKVKVTLLAREPEEYIQRYGKLPTVTEKEYTVAGLAEYVASFKGMDSSLKNELESAAKERLEYYINNSYSKSSKVSDMKYEGFVASFAGNDPNTYYEYKNNIYIIFSGMVTNTDGEFRGHKIYFPMNLVNVSTSENGTDYSYRSNPVGYAYLGQSGYYSYGYLYPDQMLSEIAAEKNGYTLEVGDGVEKYKDIVSIEKLSDIPDDFRTSVTAEAKTLIENYVAKNYGENRTVSELKAIGEYLLFKKEYSAITDANKLYIVYEGLVHSADGKFEDTKIYYPVEVYGFCKYSDGFCQYYDLNQTIKGYVSFPGEWNYTYGYFDTALMHKEIITNNADYYNVEVSDSLKAFDPEYKGEEAASTEENKTEGNTEGNTPENKEGSTEGNTNTESGATTEGNTNTQGGATTEGNTNTEGSKNNNTNS